MHHITLPRAQRVGSIQQPPGEEQLALEAPAAQQKVVEQVAFTGAEGALISSTLQNEMGFATGEGVGTAQPVADALRCQHVIHYPTVAPRLIVHYFTTQMAPSLAGQARRRDGALVLLALVDAAHHFSGQP